MQSYKKQNLMLRRDKYPYSQFHFYFHCNAQDYILFIGANRCFIVTIHQEGSKKIVQFQIEPITPIHFISTGEGDINILHQNGVWVQNVEQLLANNSFQKIDFDKKIKPKRFIKVKHNYYIIVTQEKTLAFLKEGKLTKECQYPAQMMMQNLAIDCEKRESFEVRLVVPHSQNFFPFVFSLRQLLHFEDADFLQERVKKYNYHQDQILPSQEHKMCFSSTHNKIYMSYIDKMVILEISRSQVAGMDYMVSLYLKYKLDLKDAPIFASTSNKTKKMVVVTNSHFYEIQPEQLGKVIKLCGKQKLKDSRIVNSGYELSNSNCVFLQLDATTTRLLLT